MTFRQLLEDHPRLLSIWEACARGVAAVKFQRFAALFNNGLYYNLEEVDHDRVRSLLKDGYYVVLTRRRAHLTTYLISLLSAITTGRFSHYTHALMNVEGDIANHMDFRLVEATAPGVHFSTFMEVFDCDSVVLMMPRGVTVADWAAALEYAKSAIGNKPYDNLFDLQNDKSVSCVELVYQALLRLPNGAQRFRHLLELIAEQGNDLTPQMLYDCGEFNVVYEARR